MERRLSARDAMFDPAPDADDEHSFTPAAYLPSPIADPASLVEKTDWHEDATSRMAEAITTWMNAAAISCESRWLTEEKQTLHDLADQYGVSAERIRQIEVNAIKKLRTAMAGLKPHPTDTFYGGSESSHRLQLPAGRGASNAPDRPARSTRTCRET